MKSYALKILPALLIILASHIANAQTICSGSTILLNSACSATSGSKQIWDCNDIYDFDMMFCNNTEYLSLGIATSTGCTSGSLGVMQWNDSSGTNGTGWYEYCDGTNWWSTKGKVFAACTAGERKKQRWNTPSMQFCDGSNWNVMGPTVVRLTTSQTYVIPTYVTGIIIQAWGGGGGGGATANNTLKGNDGGNTTATIASIGLSLTANGGVGGKDGANATLNGGGGLGGTASGIATLPPTTATGPTSVNGASGDNSAAAPAAGNGGQSDHGGKAGNGSAAKGGGKTSRDGGTPGSGGGGDTGNNASRKGGGGGGGAGYVRVYYTATGLSGLSLVVTIGTTPTGLGSNVQAGDGGAARVIVTYW